MRIVIITLHSQTWGESVADFPLWNNTLIFQAWGVEGESSCEVGAWTSWFQFWTSCNHRWIQMGPLSPQIWPNMDTDYMAGLNLDCNVEQDLIKSFKILAFIPCVWLTWLFLEDYNLSSWPISVWHKISFHLTGIVLVSRSKSLFLSKVCLSVPHAVF